MKKTIYVNWETQEVLSEESFMYKFKNEICTKLEKISPFAVLMDCDKYKWSILSQIRLKHNFFIYTFNTDKNYVYVDWEHMDIASETTENEVERFIYSNLCAVMSFLYSKEDLYNFIYYHQNDDDVFNEIIDDSKTIEKIREHFGLNNNDIGEKVVIR